MAQQHAPNYGDRILTTAHLSAGLNEFLDDGSDRVPRRELLRVAFQFEKLADHVEAKKLPPVGEATDD